jgi:hypothetical protein
LTSKKCQCHTIAVSVVNLPTPTEFGPRSRGSVKRPSDACSTNLGAAPCIPRRGLSLELISTGEPRFARQYRHAGDRRARSRGEERWSRRTEAATSPSRDRHTHPHSTLRSDSFNVIVDRIEAGCLSSKEDPLAVRRRPRPGLKSHALAGLDYLLTDSATRAAANHE